MKTLLGLAVSTVVVLFFTPAATAQYYAGGKESTANLTTAAATKAISQQRQPCNRSTKSADRASLAVPSVSVALIQENQPCFHYLRKTGGPPLVTLLVAGALVVAVGSGVAIRVVLRDYTSP